MVYYRPDFNLYDGAAEVDSAGFFDVNNMPPWDVWLCFVTDECAPHADYLVAWVPPAALQRADAGIRVNPEECIRWADDDETELTACLRRAGWL